MESAPALCTRLLDLIGRAAVSASPKTGWSNRWCILECAKALRTSRTRFKLVRTSSLKIPKANPQTILVWKSRSGPTESIMRSHDSSSWCLNVSLITASSAYSTTAAPRTAAIMSGTSGDSRSFSAASSCSSEGSWRLSRLNLFFATLFSVVTDEATVRSLSGESSELLLVRPGHQVLRAFRCPKAFRLV